MDNKEVITLTKKEYGELLSSEFDNGYAKGFREALEQDNVLDKIRAEIEQVIREETVVDHTGGEYERIISMIDPDDVLNIIDKYIAESEE